MDHLLIGWSSKLFGVVTGRFSGSVFSSFLHSLGLIIEPNFLWYNWINSSLYIPLPSIKQK